MPASFRCPEPTRPQGVVAVFRCSGRWLVIERAKTVRAPGMICFPGGGIEPGETEPQTLVREIDEEIGAQAPPVARLWSSRTSWGVDLAWWSAELVTPVDQLRPNPAEVAELFWLSPEEIELLPNLLPSNRQFLAAWQAGEFQL